MSRELKPGMSGRGTTRAVIDSLGVVPVKSLWRVVNLLCTRMSMSRERKTEQIVQVSVFLRRVDEDQELE